MLSSLKHFNISFSYLRDSLLDEKLRHVNHYWNITTPAVTLCSDMHCMYTYRIYIIHNTMCYMACIMYKMPYITNNSQCTYNAYIYKREREVDFYVKQKNKKSYLDRVSKLSSVGIERVSYGNQIAFLLCIKLKSRHKRLCICFKKYIYIYMYINENRKLTN